MPEHPTQYGGGHGGGYGGSPGFGRSQISRQFTEAESALDERMTSHLTAPPIQMHVGDTIGQSYKWLSDDLKLRSTLSNELAKEQSMAYQQSARHELSRQAEQQAADDNEALGALRNARELYAQKSKENPSYRMSDAVMEIGLDSGVNLALNETWGKISANDIDNIENPQQRQIRDLKETVELADLGNRNFDARLFERLRETDPEYAKKEFQKIKDIANTSQVNAGNAVVVADANRIVSRQNLIDAKDRSARYSSQIAAAGGEENLETLGGLFALADEVGIESSYFPEFVGKYGKVPSIQGMVMDAGWLEKRIGGNPEEKAALEKAIDILGNPATVNDTETRAAQATVMRYANEHQKHTQSTVLEMAEEEKADADLEAFSTSVSKSLSASQKNITSLAQGKEGKDNEPLIISEAASYINQYSAAFPDLAEEFHSKLPGSSGKNGSAIKTAARARAVISNFTSEIKKARDSQKPELPAFKSGEDQTPARTANSVASPQAPAQSIPDGTVRSAGGATYVRRDGQWYKK